MEQGKLEVSKDAEKDAAEKIKKAVQIAMEAYRPNVEAFQHDMEWSLLSEEIIKLLRSLYEEAKGMGRTLGIINAAPVGGGSSGGGDVNDEDVDEEGWERIPVRPPPVRSVPPVPTPVPLRGDEERFMIVGKASRLRSHINNMTPAEQGKLHKSAKYHLNSLIHWEDKSENTRLPFPPQSLEALNKLWRQYGSKI